jgi:WD40 repeat protein
MISKIKRRKFSQIVIATATTTLISDLAVKAVAQKPQELILGLQIAGEERKSQDTTLNLVISELDLVSGQVTTKPSLVSVVADTQVLSLDSGADFKHRITGLNRLENGSFIASLAQTSRQGGSSYLIEFNQQMRSQRVKKISGLQSYQTVESFVHTQNGFFLCLLALNQTPPFKLGILDYSTGSINSIEQPTLLKLRKNFRYSNLVIAPDGDIYATAMGGEGTTKLVKFDITNQKVTEVTGLSINSQPMTNDALDLVFSSARQLFALAVYQQSKRLFLVNIQNGNMEPVRAFSGDKIVFG